LDEICRRYDVRRIRFFGSVLRDDFGPESDIDMMVEFGSGAPGGWGIFHFDEELPELFGRKADVLHGQPVRYIRDQILAEAKTVYVAPDAMLADNDSGASGTS
jgi:predicted nucleotidyltransferase